MKTLLLSAALLSLLPIAASAQCRPITCEDIPVSVPISGIVSSNNPGNLCYSGSGLLYEYTTDTTWQMRVMSGDIAVGDTFSVPPAATLYINGTATFDYLRAGSSSVIQVNGICNIALRDLAGTTFLLASDTATLFLQGHRQAVGGHGEFVVIRCGATGITEVEPQSKFYRSGIYNLLGQRLNAAPVGVVYIENGVKKFILK